MEKVLPENKPIESFEIEDDFPGLGRRVSNLNARKISQPGNHTHRMLLVFEDITDRKQRERDAQVLTNEISHRIKNNAYIKLTYATPQGQDRNDAAIYLLLVVVPPRRCTRELRICKRLAVDRGLPRPRSRYLGAQQVAWRGDSDAPFSRHRARCGRGGGVRFCDNVGTRDAARPFASTGAVLFHRTSTSKRTYGATYSTRALGF